MTEDNETGEGRYSVMAAKIRVELKNAKSEEVKKDLQELAERYERMAAHEDRPLGKRH